MWATVLGTHTFLYFASRNTIVYGTDLRKVLTWVWQGEENNNSCEIIPVLSQKQRQKKKKHLLYTENELTEAFQHLKFQKKKKKKEQCLSSSKPGFSNTWTMKFQMFYIKENYQG